MKASTIKIFSSSYIILFIENLFICLFIYGHVSFSFYAASMTGILFTRRKPRETNFRHWCFEKE